MTTIDGIMEELKKDMPPILAGTELDNYTGKGYRYRTLLDSGNVGLQGHPMGAHRTFSGFYIACQDEYTGYIVNETLNFKIR